MKRLLLVEDDPSIRRYVALALEDEGLERIDEAGTLSAALDCLRSAQLVAFSAGVAPAMRQRLFDLGVARILDKPVSLQALLDCVRQVSATPTAEETSPHDPEAPAIERHFGGQHSLIVDFRAASRQQFAVDLEQGDAMMAGDDVQSLRRLAHSLKTVMRLLGRSDAAVRAAALEHAAQQPGATMVSLQDAWQRLRQDLL